MVYRYRTTQLINTLIIIKYVHYIQHGEVMHININQEDTQLLLINLTNTQVFFKVLIVLFVSLVLQILKHHHF